MKNIKNYATSLTSLTFIVIGLSGIMLFLDIGKNYVKDLHEVLGLAFVVVALLHVVANWTLMKKYFSKKVFLLSSILVLAVSVAFISQGRGDNGVNPKRYVLSVVLDKPFPQALEILNLDKSKTLGILSQKGYKIDISKSIHQNAKDNSISPFEIVSKIIN